MNLVRGIGRMLLGGYYISNGVRAVRHPAEFADGAQPLTERLAPLAQRVLPDAAAGYVPVDAKAIVRVSGIASVAGGVGMALGIGSRASATVAAASMVPTLLAANPSGLKGPDKMAARSEYLRTVALFGAALVVSQDTKGKPSMIWRARDSKARLARDADRTRKVLAKEAARTQDQMSKNVRRANRTAKVRARAALKSIEAS